MNANPLKMSATVVWEGRFEWDAGPNRMVGFPDHVEKFLRNGPLASILDFTPAPAKLKVTIVVEEEHD